MATERYARKGRWTTTHWTSLPSALTATEGGKCSGDLQHLGRLGGSVLVSKEMLLIPALCAVMPCL